MIQKKLSLHLHFTVNIDESAIPQREDKDEREYSERQKRLLQAILANQERFHAYLAYQVTSAINYLTWQDWDEMLLGSSDEQPLQILKPILATLDSEDQQFFKEADEEGVFYENIEEMEGCFTANLDSCKLVVEVQS